MSERRGGTPQASGCGDQAQRFGADAGGVKRVGAAELQEQLRTGAPILVDVREAAEFVGPLAHIPGARLIPLGTLQARIGELRGLERRPIVLVCRSGARSFTAGLLLRAAGFEDVASLEGGMLAWGVLGFEVTREV